MVSGEFDGGHDISGREGDSYRGRRELNEQKMRSKNTKKKQLTSN